MAFGGSTPEFMIALATASADSVTSSTGRLRVVSRPEASRYTPVYDRIQGRRLQAANRATTEYTHDPLARCHETSGFAS